MLNRSTKDLESATIRTRFFGGRPADAIAAEMPIVSITAPLIPAPGPTFVRFANLLGDQPPDVPAPPGKTKGKKKGPVIRPDGANLTGLVRSALYQYGTTVQVEVAGEQEPILFQPGVLDTNSRDGDPYGPSKCRLMVVGKCLGLLEERQKRPFFGPGSRPLWDCWKETGLPERSVKDPVFLTNIVRFCPPLRAGGKIPKEWVADGLHLFYQEVAICRPEVILLLGADALKAVMGATSKISDYRGRSVPMTFDFRSNADDPPDLHTAQVVATDHPLAVSRDTDVLPSFMSGLRMAGRLLGSCDQVAKIPIDHQPIYTLEELKRAVAESCKAASAGGYLAFDTEWEGRHPSDPGAYVYTVQWSHAPGHGRCVFLRRCGGAPNESLPTDKTIPLLNKLFAEAHKRGTRLVGHFAKADLPWLEFIGVDLYPYFVGPPDEENPDGVERLFGWQRTAFEGGFDTYVASHATDETARQKLEILAANLLGVDRYDMEMIAWKQEYCKSKKMKQSRLLGYGNAPEEKIYPYGCFDADVSGRLYLFLNGDPREGTTGLLDCDRFGLNARRIFGLRMRAWGAWAEMERNGMEVDLRHHYDLRAEVVAKRTELIAKIREETNWHEVLGPDGKVLHPAFDPSKRRHVVELLFGEQHLDCPSIRPPGALSLYLKPYMATSKYKDRLWDEAVFRQERDGLEPPSPAANQESIIHLALKHDVVDILKDIGFLSTAMKILFRLPDEVVGEDDDDVEEDDSKDPWDGEVHMKGLLAALRGDGRVRSVFGLVETGRASSGGGLNLQNISGGKDEQFDRIFGWGKEAEKGSPNAKRTFCSRAVFRARKGWWYVGADLKGAEIAAAAWSSGDELLIEHARRNNLDQSDPEWLDLHADLANKAFNLGLSLSEVKRLHKGLRIAAKRTRFGHYYGASPATILRQVLEESTRKNPVNVTVEEIEAIVRGHDKAYPVLANFFAGARSRPQDFGYLMNGFGGIRRFRPTNDRELSAAQGREAQNWTCQALVADAMNCALGNLWYELRLRDLKSRILLSVHDSIMLECPPEELELVVDVILPLCMSEKVPIVPTDFNGNPLGRGPYHFGIDVEVGQSWGINAKEEHWRAVSKAAREAQAATAA